MLHASCAEQCIHGPFVHDDVKALFREGLSWSTTIQVGPSMSCPFKLHLIGKFQVEPVPDYRITPMLNKANTNPPNNWGMIFRKKKRYFSATD